MIDLSRSVITVALGTWDVSPTAEFAAGQFVKLGADGKVTNITAKTDVPLGIAKWNKINGNSMRVPVIGEAIVLSGTTAVNLAHGSVENGSVRVTSYDGATVYAETTDYTVNYANGQITRVGGGTIPDGATVLVSYRYAASDVELDLLYGKNWMNTLDDTMQVGKITVIQDFAVVYSDQYDSAQGYTVGGSLYLTANGRVTSDSSGGATKVGICVKVPTIDDPYLGIQIG
jgi:hypothetical protein